MDKKTLEKIHNELFNIEVEVLENGTLPFKKNPTDAGFDLIAAQDVILGNGTITKTPLDIRLKLPKGTYAEITTKSGLGSKGMLVYAGIIDEEYRGIPHVICTCLNQIDPIIKIKKGEKIAQMIIHPYCPDYTIKEVDKIDTNTQRGEGGFGSTGK